MLLPFALLDWVQAGSAWHVLPAVIGIYTLAAFPIGLIGGAFERLWGPVGRRVIRPARKDAVRVAALAGVAAAVGSLMLFLLWAQRFNHAELGALIGALAMLPAAVVGGAVGLVTHRLVVRILPGGHLFTTTWIGILGLAITVALLAHREARPDLWATVHFPLLPFLPLLPGLWMKVGQRIRAWPNKPRWLLHLVWMPLLILTLGAPNVGSELVLGEGLVARVVMGLRALNDFDGDGFSAWLGGGDCDDFSATHHPGAFDKPKDGIDQDCDGTDFIPTEPNPKGVFAPLPKGVEAARNLLLVTVDTLRADRLPWHDSVNDTMPQTHKLLVKNGVAFDRAYANGVRSQRSVPSLIIGRYPSHLKWGPDGKDAVSVGAENKTLGEHLKAAGFVTHAVIMEKYFAKQKGLTQGFEFHRQRRIKPGFSSWHKPTSELVTDYTLRLLARLKRSDKRFAVWVHYYDPHIRFTRSRFGKDATARYDESLAVTDKALGRLLRSVDLKTTVVALASDHGQGLGTHGHHGHGSHLYEEAIHVPLVFAGGPIKPGRSSAVVQNVDLVPTALNLVGLAPVETPFDGRSLLPALVGGALPERPAFAEALPDPHTTDHAWAIVDGDLKLIHDLRKQTAQWFDLAGDPSERHPLPTTSAAGSMLLRRLNHHRATAQWLNAGNYGGRKKKARQLAKLPDRIEGDLNIRLGDKVRLKSYALLDPPIAGARLRLRLNLRALSPIDGRLNAMVHIEGQTTKGTKVFLNRDQPIRPSPSWRADESREVVLSFLIPRASRGGQVTVKVGLFPPGKRKWKAKGAGVDRKGRVDTVRVTLR
jgi:arylsulfatase A-like enzyme